MRRATVIVCLLILVTEFLGPSSVMADDGVVAFAVVSEDPKDTARVSARIAIDGAVSEMRLLASEQILSNLIWKKLEICHALKLEGLKSPDGFHVRSVRAIDAAMLPMVLQGFAGDCLLRKALEIAPFVD
ncbi:MAG: hypothetical protein OEY12_15155 [Nitrospira sp.]|nr:hypothetical protein [Nitrospira sp.]